MRTEMQVKRKLNELQLQKQALESRLSSEPQASSGELEAAHTISAQIERLDEMILLLEWVLNEPMGSYHV